jgi:hypothetical protein
MPGNEREIERMNIIHKLQAICPATPGNRDIGHGGELSIHGGFRKNPYSLSR